MILKRVIEKQVISASDIKDIFPGKANAEVSRQIKKLIDRKIQLSSFYNIFVLPFFFVAVVLLNNFEI
jgi:hypothetical protein